MGVRVFDIRLSIDDDDDIGKHFDIHHGGCNLGVDFNYVLYNCMSFLLDNPSETIIMSYQDKSNSFNDPESLLETFQEYLASDGGEFKNIMYTANRVPEMRTARGKIVLLNFKEYEILNNRQNKVPGLWNMWTNCPDAQKIKLDTSCSVVNDWTPQNCPNQCETYIKSLENNMKRAKTSNTNKQLLHITYASASKGLESPLNYADTVNPEIKEWLEEQSGPADFGIVMTDFPNAQLIKEIYSKNFS